MIGITALLDVLVVGSVMMAAELSHTRKSTKRNQLNWFINTPEHKLVGNWTIQLSTNMGPVQLAAHNSGNRTIKYVSPADMEKMTANDFLSAIDPQAVKAAYEAELARIEANRI